MSTLYPDRRAELFGREPAIHALCDRARKAGLTVVAARPLMGKTWTLIEVARRLEEEGTFVVGYHESKGAESSHLLYAVADLYTRWLEGSGLGAQARSLWERHKDGLLPRVGKAVGAIFEKLGGAVLPDGVGSLVQKAFEGLADAQKDLATGGLQLAPLPYDEALALTNLVARLSEKRVVLILDAWEKSPSIPKEFATLEAFAKSPAAWPDAHLMLAVRNPESDTTKLNDEAFRRAKDLCAITGSAKVHELAPMDRADPKEVRRSLAFIRDSIPAAKAIDDQRLVDMIDGYPGVINFWLDPSVRNDLRTASDLVDQAGNAQALRYTELKHQLAGLKEPELSLAARLAIFPRLDAAAWAGFSEILLGGGAADPFHSLVDAKILADEPFPTFGHDTRYVAARRWFLDNHKAFLRRRLEAIVDALASSIDDVDALGRPFFEALSGCAEGGLQVGLDHAHACLIGCARSAFGDLALLFAPGFHEACAAACQRQPDVGTLVGLALMSRAVENERRGQSLDAIADYDRLIDLPSTGAREKMKALTNRGVMKRRLGLDSGLDDCNRAIELPGVPEAQRALALFNRATMRNELGDKPGEIADYTRVIDTEGASADDVASALFNRAIVKRELGDFDGANADLQAVIVLPSAPPIPLGKALRNRAIQRLTDGDRDGALADYATLGDLAGADAADITIAAYNSAAVRCEMGDWARGIADYTQVVEFPGAQPDMVAKALIHRGTARGETGDLRATFADLTAAAAVEGVSDEVAELARTRLDILRGTLERSDRLDALNPAPDTP